MDSEIRDLASLKIQYPDEWLAVSMPEGEDQYAPQRGRLITHNRERAATWDRVARLAANQAVYVFFTGSITAKGFGISFNDTADTPDVATVGD
ncbi:MAG: hypothetical protein HZC40_18300 [Chloroflexi bacterium]|nr:hypothetical protein [Chloroflexota bacterium]